MWKEEASRLGLRLLFRTFMAKIKCVKVRALFTKKKVRFARAEQLWSALEDYRLLETICTLTSSASLASQTKQSQAEDTSADCL